MENYNLNKCVTDESTNIGTYKGVLNANVYAL